MAPKKNIPAADATTAPPAEKKPRAAKKAAATTDAADGEAKKRNMSAVSGEFVSQVQKALPEDLSAKLRVKDVKEICEAFVKTLVGNVMDGKNVNFTNHMSFARRVRAARVYKNLKTKESIEKPKHYVLSMTVKPNLKKAFDAIEVTA